MDKNIRIRVINGCPKLGFKKGQIYEIYNIYNGGAKYSHMSRIDMRIPNIHEDLQKTTKVRSLWVYHKNFIDKPNGFCANNGDPTKFVRFVKV